MWSLLRAKRLGGFKFRRQHVLGEYIVDFVCLHARLVIEVDGDRHGNDERQALDDRRTEYIEKAGYKVIRFWNSEVLNFTDDVAHAIAHELGLIPPPQRESFPVSPDPSP